jgi:hypothetical protein
MSRQLPPHPSLEYLKKNAKELLRDIRQRDPDFKLADAQRAIAREYGFSSWSKLKAHVESSTPVTHIDSLNAGTPPINEPVSLTNSGDYPPIFSAPTAAPEFKNQFAGAWTANMSKSRPHPDSPFHCALLHVDVVGDKVTITDIVIDASGREERHENVLKADGLEHKSDYGGYALVANWIGSNALETVVKKNGQVEGRVKYEISADYATLIISTGDQLFVCDRR